ncbi:helix-turn-helix transcriptional regulator [Streptomyces sp. TRM68416]|uniref:helix-turn-helix transcriptional regulator n=1 Tax=Streptomyces sp. TRM68416 TaxID=2758412 RepID=UPI001661E93A|nr:LuxR C-terminal-related transcriptional regulator [Streptomyces sp. TRM68416]MBD0837398.1 hypothetical protein [Streptomyces sp. TRM68416]
MTKPPTTKGVDLVQVRRAGLRLPRTTVPGQPWTPRTPAEHHLLGEAQRLYRNCLLLLEEIGQLRQQATVPSRAEQLAAAAREAERLKACPLAPAQLKAIEAAAAGESVHATARRLSLSFETVRSHRQRAMKRLDARDIEQAVEVCTAAGWITAAQTEGGATP